MSIEKQREDKEAFIILFELCFIFVPQSFFCLYLIIQEQLWKINVVFHGVIFCYYFVLTYTYMVYNIIILILSWDKRSEINHEIFISLQSCINPFSWIKLVYRWSFLFWLYRVSRQVGYSFWVVSDYFNWYLPFSQGNVKLRVLLWTNFGRYM